MRVIFNGVLMLTVLAFAPVARAGHYEENFDGYDDGAKSLKGATVVSVPAEVIQVRDKSLRLTQTGVGDTWSYIRIDNLDKKDVVRSFDVSFKYQFGGNRAIADGFAFVFGDIGDCEAEEGGEKGFEKGLAVGFDTYAKDSESDEENAIGFHVWSDANHLVSDAKHNDLLTKAADFRTVKIHWDANGLTLTVNDKTIFKNVKTPDIKPQAGWQFAVTARTGGVTQETRIDDLNITTTVAPEPAAAGKP